jgi:hydrogenase small subunit
MSDGSNVPYRGGLLHSLGRRDFLKFCGSVAATLALPRTAAAEIEAAVTTLRKPVVVWLSFQGCTGDTESLLRADNPGLAELVLDLLSVDYHENLMATAGSNATSALAEALEAPENPPIAIVEGSIPAGADGAYCTVGGQSALAIAREVCGRAAATVAMGTCAAYGGIPAAAPNPTAALSVAEAIPAVKNLICLPGCPANVENLTALVLHFLTYQRWPELDRLQRPLFAHGKMVHDSCERRAHYEAGQFVEHFDDSGHRAGYCLYKMGCKGPATHHNCPEVRWNGSTSWPVGSGHPCVGCAEPHFWDEMTPFYTHLPGISARAGAASLDQVGLGATAAVAAGLAGHGLLSRLRNGGGGTAGRPPADRDEIRQSHAKTTQGEK